MTVSATMRLRQAANDPATAAETSYLLRAVADQLDDILTAYNTWLIHEKFHHRPYCPACEQVKNAMHDSVRRHK